MEPMTLGSPSSPSTSTAANNFLPAYLMGETNIPTTPRSNTLSPTKGRTLAFGQSPRGVTASPPPELFNRSLLQQKALFGYQQQQSSTPSAAHNSSAQQHNASISGPPTQGLFDALKSEKHRVNEPNAIMNASYSQNHNISNRAQLPSQYNPTMNQSYQYNDSINDSYLNQSDFNVSRLTSPIQTTYDFRSGSLTNLHHHNDSMQFTSPRAHHSVATFWVTVFGFPQTATNTILAHFSQCGTIVDKIFPSQGGNWVHLKFASRLECDKAINYNERILAGSLMLGVVYCKDPAIVDKENMERNIPINRVRPLANLAFKNAQTPTEVVLSPTIPKRSTGIVNKAMDMIFGW